MFLYLHDLENYKIFFCKESSTAKKSKKENKY
jgi:hypothetical protein